MRKILSSLILIMVFLFLFSSTSLCGTTSDTQLELQRQYEFSCRQPSDINEHVPTLRHLANECSSVVEIGMRTMVSSWGLLQGLSENSSPSRSYLGIDIASPPSETLFLARQLAEDNEISFDFWQADDMIIDIEPTEMLFIDSLHTYCHLTYELEKFSPKVSKYIAMHDTSWGDIDDPVYTRDFSEYPPEYDRTKRGLWLAISDFLQRHPEWTLHKRYLNNYGFTILKRVVEPHDKKKKLKVGFFLEHLTVRGTEVSTYNYADFNEKLLNNESYVLYVSISNFFPDDSPECVKDVFKQRFKEKFYECASLEEMDEIIQKEKIDVLYLQKCGQVDDKLSKICKNAVHAVFPPLQVHGDTYASLSEWFTRDYPTVPYVPYMVQLSETSETLHDELKISSDAVVFGRHGGHDSFNIGFAKEAVQEAALAHPNWYYIFLNTDRFCDLPNVIFLPPTSDLNYKTKFINTCDAMIHARDRGETFGLACAEFSIKNKPVITCGSSPERCHIDILGNKGFYYSNKQDLINIITQIGNDIDMIRLADWDAYSQNYNPETVMKQFDDVFLNPLRGIL